MLSQGTPICDPTKLGPLSQDPVVATGSVRLFAGEERFLSRRKRDEREVSDLDIVAASVWPEDLAVVEPQIEDTVRSAALIPHGG